MSRSILLIDDDPQILGMLGRFFERRGWIVSRAEDCRGGIALYDAECPDLVLLDLQLPGLSGLDLLAILRDRDPVVAVIMLTGHGEIASAVEAMRLGAENFLTKPVELPHIEAAVERAYEKVQLRRRSRLLSERQSQNGALADLGASPSMRALAREVSLLADGSVSVLLQGETGVGKGWMAQLIHSLSPRANAPFVEINCAGLTSTFLDSELFGHEKGAFTDAKAQKRGLFEVADGGTLFLDEIGDLARELQPKLLKVLESRRFRRLGGTRETEVDVRVVAATNHDLAAAVRAGTFREDLYYRLAVVPLRLPPLRDRTRDEIIELACRILENLYRGHGRTPARIAPETLEVLARYPWPGNIRELRNVLERVLLLAGGVEEILPRHLPAELRSAREGASTENGTELTLAEVERRHIARVLARCGGNRSRAARILGIARATLYDKLKRYDLAHA